MYKSVYLKKGKEESLKRFHPWIFSGAIQAMDEGIEEGDIVRVFTRSGEFIAIGHYQIGSIAVRVLSFRDIEIDEEYWCARLDSAYKMRLALGIPSMSLSADSLLRKSVVFRFSITSLPLVEFTPNSNPVSLS